MTDYDANKPEEAGVTAEDFLPEDYSIPEGDSPYMKFTEPENRFRVLGKAITGYELWVEGKPVRRKDKSEFTPEELRGADVNKFTGKRRLPQYFWAFPVWNYKTERVEVLEITQVTVMRGIEDYLNDPDYGRNPQDYDLIVIKDESGDKVEYRVKAKPPKKMDAGIKKYSQDLNIRLEALFEGGDPFSGDDDFDIDPDEIDKVS